MQEKLELQPCQPRAVKDPRSLSPSLKSGSNAKETLFARLCGFLFSFLYRSRYLPRCFLFFLLLFLHFFRYEFLYGYSVLGIIIGFIRDTHAGNIFEREKKKKKKESRILRSPSRDPIANYFLAYRFRSIFLPFEGSTTPRPRSISPVASLGTKEPNGQR